MSDSLKVLHVLAPMREGGLERVVTMMAAGRAHEAVHVAVVVEPGDANGHPFIARLQARGVPVTPIVVGARSYRREYQLLSGIVDRLRSEIVHTHGYRADVIGGAVARAHGIPTVSTVHGFTGGGLRDRLYEWIQVWALRRADAVVAVSAPLVDRLVRSGIPRNNICCVPNAFSPEGETVTRSAARQLLGIRNDAQVAGWVGRLSPEKGADVMLEALARCERSWLLSIIGEGRELDGLRRHAATMGIADRVLWHGPIANAGALLRAFDAFVLSSRTEGTPITLLEAMHAGVPIIATTVGGVPDVVTSEHARLVPPEEPQMIADALADLKRDPLAAARRSTLAGERVRESFDPAPWLAAIDAIYRTVRAEPSAINL